MSTSAEGEELTLATEAKDGIRREMAGFRVTPYNIPVGCIGAHDTEASPLVPVWHYAEGSKTPAAKSIPVRVRRQTT